MNLLLEQKYKYILLYPVDDVRSQIKSILKTPWYDLAINLTGNISEDNQFKVYPKFSLFSLKILGLLRSSAIINGKLEPNGEQTNVFVVVRPSYGYLFVFYLLVFFFLLKLFGLFTTQSEKEWILVSVLFFLIIFFRSIIYFSVGRLKDRFERNMSIHPEESF